MGTQALHAAATGNNIFENHLEIIANNVANLESKGFRASYPVTSDLPYSNITPTGHNNLNNPQTNNMQVGSGAKVVGIYKSQEQGSLQETKHRFDLAIAGPEGYFQLEDPNGNMVYTRDGNFKVDPARGNQLVHSASNNVLVPNIALPNADEFEISNLVIDQYGQVSLQREDGEEVLGRIQLATFNDTKNLSSKANNLVVPSGGDEPIIFNPGEENNSTIQQGFLEDSNVQTATELIKMTSVSKSSEACYKVIRTEGERLKNINEIA
jgi:flagellar basal-body rod protein FlgG